MLRNIAFRVAQQQSAMRPPHVVTPQQDESLVLIQAEARRGLYSSVCSCGRGLTRSASDLNDGVSTLARAEVARERTRRFRLRSRAPSRPRTGRVSQRDSSPYEEMWSRLNPITLFPPEGPDKSGWDEVSRTFRWVSSRFSHGTPGSVEIVAAGVSGDLAYTVAWERASVSWEGGPVQPSTLRATHVYRREDGEWKIVHRHGGGGPAVDHLVGKQNQFGQPVSADQRPPAEQSTGLPT
jgi:ketosteroid isomerase-like protein